MDMNDAIQSLPLSMRVFIPQPSTFRYTYRNTPKQYIKTCDREYRPTCTVKRSPHKYCTRSASIPKPFIQESLPYTYLPPYYCYTQYLAQPIPVMYDHYIYIDMNTQPSH